MGEPPPDEDAWAAGRAATAAEVRDIFTRHRAPGPAREHHDALPSLVRLPRFLLDKLPRGRRRAVVAIAAALAVLIAGGIWVAHEAANRARLREARAEAHFRAGVFRRLAADQQAHTARIGAVPAAALGHRLEELIGRDARTRVREGSLAGPIRRTVCRRGNGLVNRAEDPNLYRCLAITSSAVGVTLGHEFFVRVYPARGIALWCHNNYPPGHPETQDVISVPVSDACAGR